MLSSINFSKGKYTAKPRQILVKGGEGLLVMKPLQIMKNSVCCHIVYLHFIFETLVIKNMHCFYYFGRKEKDLADKLNTIK